MISIEPYDALDDLSCRWKIQGYGVVSEENIVNALRLYARDLQDEAEELKKEV